MCKVYYDIHEPKYILLYTNTYIGKTHTKGINPYIWVGGNMKKEQLIEEKEIKKLFEDIYLSLNEQKFLVESANEKLVEIYHKIQVLRGVFNEYYHKYHNSKGNMGYDTWEGL